MIDPILALGEVSTEAIILELRHRGFRAIPTSVETLNWNRTIEKNFNEEAFRWEAVHKIAGMLKPEHLDFTKRNYFQGQVMRGALYLR